MSVDQIAKAASIIEIARGLIVAAGAGMDILKMPLGGIPDR